MYQRHSIAYKRAAVVVAALSVVAIHAAAEPVHAAAAPLRIVSYNVENLFHPAHDSVAGEPKDDLEWTLEGERRWTYARYRNKVENIARVLTNIGEWEGVDIVGLCEVENAQCVKQLCNVLRHGEYDFVHYESPDRRGIDVALVYKKSRIDTLQTRPIPVSLVSPDNGVTETTRDVLYVHAKTDDLDTLHLFVCHMPSQLGGRTGSEWKRKAVRNILQNAVDSVLQADSQARIIVMGDMNSSPADDLAGLNNRMKDRTDSIQNTKGTHKWHGQWTCLDQFYTSPALDTVSSVRIYDAEWIQETDERYMGLKPKRTYNGFRYQNGFSDHLPIVLTIR